MGSNANTPLAKLLKLRAISQGTVAGKLELRQSTFSRIVRHGKASVRMAERVVNEVDPERQFITELHVLYPERYPDWDPAAVSA